MWHRWLVGGDLDVYPRFCQAPRHDLAAADRFRDDFGICRSVPPRPIEKRILISLSINTGFERFPMSVYSRVAARVIRLKKDGFRGIMSILRSRCISLKNKYASPMFYDNESLWKMGIKAEVEFWDDFFRTKGLQWSDRYRERFDPVLPLQPRPTSLLSDRTDIHILDVGAGPLTYLGKTSGGKQISIIAVDPLADEYDKLLKKYQIKPLVRTLKLAAEDLGRRFASNTFDLVYARNCIDHAYDPEKAILQMIDVAKSGRYILLEHRLDEADTEGYSDLHQWNFSTSRQGDLLIGSRLKKVNMTAKYVELCTITNEIVNEPGDGEWLITVIRKRGSAEDASTTLLN